MSLINARLASLRDELDAQVKEEEKKKKSEEPGKPEKVAKVPKKK